VNDANIRATRNTAQLIGSLITAALIHLAITRGLLTSEQVESATAAVPPRIWEGGMVLLGALVYSQIARLARWVSPDLGPWLEGYPTPPTYPTASRSGPLR